MVKKIHYITGAIIAVFITFHLLNHLLIIGGEEVHLEFMKAARVIYRNIIVEPVLLLCILVQVITGIRLVFKKWRHQESLFDRLQLISGLYFVYFLVGHTSAVIYCRFILNLDSNLYFGASGLNAYPLYFYFIFHYGLSIIFFFTHVACAHRNGIIKYVSQKTANIHAYGIIILGIILATIILYKMMHINIPKEYHFSHGEYPSMSKLP